MGALPRDRLRQGEGEGGMSRSKRKAKEKHIQGKFVALPNWMADTPAWRSLSLAARCVWFELMRRWKGPHGSNNGDLYLSSREAADFLNIGKGSAQRAFHELQDRGFIRITRPPASNGETAGGSVSPLAML